VPVKIVPVLLSGGVGSRLWPMSRTEVPKQLQSLVGAESMIQATAMRLRESGEVGAPVVVCGVRHLDRIVGQLAEVGIEPAHVVAEPVGRNTAPAVMAAALVLDPEAVMVVLPADHVIADVDGFRDAVRIAADAAGQGRLVTFGIVPTAPETGYGYIEAGPGGEVRPVVRFVEKPDAETAARYVASGRFLWNSGMFVFRAGEVRAEIERFAPDVAASVAACMAKSERAGRFLLSESFEKAPSISFDHAVMEHTDRAVVVPIDVGWSDVGSWSTLWEIGDQDENGNVVVGDVALSGVRQSYVRSGGRLVAVVGLDDVVVVDTGDAVLVTSRHQAQDVRSIVDQLTGRPEVERGAD